MGAHSGRQLTGHGRGTARSNPDTANPLIGLLVLLIVFTSRAQSPGGGGTGLARRFTDPSGRRWRPGSLAALPAPQAVRLCEQVTIDLDTTDVEVYGRKKRGVAYNHQGQRCGRPHVASWAEIATVLAADLMAGNDDPRAHAAGLLGRALAALPAPARSGRIFLRADAGYFAGQLARAAQASEVGFAIGAKRIAPAVADPRRVAETAWADAVDMDSAQVAVAG